MYKYTNGNALVTLESDGTRTIEYDGELDLQYPLNLDIRVQSICPLGYNPVTSKAVCTFCHESATTDGSECDYDLLVNKLHGLPKGIEIAIGCNIFTDGFKYFLTRCREYNYVCNVTINQLSINKHERELIDCIQSGLIHGLGVSYRSTNFKIPQYFKDYENMVVHVIAGIDDIDEVLKLDVRKILVLGEKDFGFNEGKVNLDSQNHKKWYWYLRKLFDKFDVVSFDNLALDQLNVKRLIPDEHYKVFYQGEHSFYINAVTQTFSRSSRSPETIDWNKKSIPEYYQMIKDKQ